MSLFRDSLKGTTTKTQKSYDEEAQKLLKESEARVDAKRKEIEKQNKQVQDFQDYINKNGIENVNKEYSNYMQGINSKLSPTLSNTDLVQNNLRNLSELPTATDIAQERAINELPKDWDSLSLKDREKWLLTKTNQDKLKQGVNLADSPNVITASIGKKMGQTPTDDSLLKLPENMKDNNRRFEDGYQFGDVAKTLGENFVDSASAIGSTLFEAPVRVAKGVLSVPENIANAGASLIAGGADLIGQDRFANALRKQVATGTPFTTVHNALENSANVLNKNSFSGGLLDSATEGIGQTFGQMAVSAAIGKAGIGTKMGEIPLRVGKFSMNMPISALVTGLGSSAAETYSQAEQQLNGIENATWREKVQMALKIAGGGTVEGLAEGFFGLMGMGGSSFGDKISGKLMNGITDRTEKIIADILISGGGEAFEELISYAGNWLWNNNVVDNLGRLKLGQEWNSKDLIDEMLSAFISSSISQGSSNINQINKLTNNAIQVAEYQQRRNLTNLEKQNIRNQMTDLVLEAKEELQQMYPQAQRMSDLQNVRQTVQNNNNYLRQKYGIEPTNTNLNLSDRLRLKYNLPARNVQPSTSQNMTQNNAEQQITQPQNKNQNLVPNNSSIQGLEDYTEQDIKDMVADHIQDITDAKINNITLRQENGNLQAVVESDTDLSEIEPLEVDGNKIDIVDSMVFEPRIEYEGQTNIDLDNPTVTAKAEQTTNNDIKQVKIDELPKQESKATPTKIAQKAEQTNKTVTPKEQIKDTGKIDDFGEKIGGARKDMWQGTSRHATKEVTHNYSIARDTVTEDGKDNTSYSVKFKGKTLQDGFKTEQEAQEFIDKFKDVLKSNSASVKEFTTKDSDGNPKTMYEVIITDPKTLKKRYTGKAFSSKEEAESYAIALSMYLSEHGKNLFRPTIQKIERTNPNLKNSTKVTGQEILDTFKFRAGEFGNWVSNAERQKFLNYGYDALQDLAAALDILPEDLSYGGKMAIAFGARGQGFSGALAHFEPVKKVINMTRLKGAGSLAHEMGHGLDNYLSQLSGYDKDGLLSKNERYNNLPNSVKEAFKALLDSIEYNISTDQEEIDKKNKIFEKNRLESLKYHLSYYDKVFNGNATKYKRVKGEYKNVPIEVTDKQKKEYQRIKSILENGTLENKRDYQYTNGRTPRDFKSVVVYAEPLETLKTMIKDVTGRKVDDDTIYWLYKYGIPSQQVKEIRSESAFSKAAKETDKLTGRASPYSSTIEEMIARSFEAFVYDELEKKGIKNTYLVHSVYNKDYALFNPYPAGEERKAIDKAWRNLIEAMKQEGIFHDSDSDMLAFEDRREYNPDILKEESTPYNINNGFYSQVEKVISTKMPNKADAQTIKNLLNKNGAKQDELNWLDMDTFLASKDSFTKQEVLDYIRANQLELEEVVKDDYTKERAEEESAELQEQLKDVENEANSIAEKYEIYSLRGNVFDRVSDIESLGKDIEELVDLTKFDLRDDGNYYYNVDGDEYFTLEEMQKDLERLQELYNESIVIDEKLGEIPETDYGYADDLDDSTKYKQYATKFKGGENYREVLFKLPNFKGDGYYSPHWNEKNVLAHTRLQDYTDDKGKNVLFVEEIQSDLHQQGRKRGYFTQEEKATLKRLKQERSEAFENINKINHSMNMIARDYLMNELETIDDRKHKNISKMYQIEQQIKNKGVSDVHQKMIDIYNESRFGRWDSEFNKEEIFNQIGYDAIQEWIKLQGEYDNLRAEMAIASTALETHDNSRVKNVLEKLTKNKEYQKMIDDLSEAKGKYIDLDREISKYSNYSVDERFPFKKNWHEFVLRKIINEAVQNGYDKVAWTTGTQQNDRYTLAKYVDKLEYAKLMKQNNDEQKYRIIVYPKNARYEGQYETFENKTEKELEDLIGKEITNKIVNSEKSYGAIEGLDLEIGGEGMKGFYDKIIPDYLSKYLKKWDSKIEDVVIDGHHQQGFTITPEMKESISKEGQMLFEPRNQYKSTDNTAPKVIESTGKLQGNKPNVVGNRVWEGFKKTGYIDLTGKKVNSEQDLAEYGQIFRNPQYETFRVIYLKGNSIVGQEAVSSKTPGSSMATTEDSKAKTYYKIADRMKRLGADGYYLVHNHPSGKAVASKADVNVTKQFSQEVKGFKGHVIVNNGTYAFIDTMFNTENKKPVDSSNSLYKGSQFQTKIPNNKVPWNNIKILGKDDITALMYNLKNDPNYSSLILRDSDGNLNAIIDVPNTFFNMKQEQVEGYIKNVAKQYGSVEAFVATNNSDVYGKLRNITNLMDSILYENGNTENTKTLNQVFSNKDTNKAYRVAEENVPYGETKEQRAERVRKYIEETQKSIGTLGAKVSRKDIVNRIIDNYGITTRGNSKELNRVSKEIQDLIQNGGLTDGKIEGYAEQLIDNLKVTIDDYYNANKELKELIRRTKLYVSDNVKAGFGDFNDFKKQYIGTIRMTNDRDALPVDTFYKELAEVYGETFFPSDIVNASDQLEKIAEVASQIKKIDKSLRENIEENFGEDAREEIVKGLVDNFKTLREKAKEGKPEDSFETPEIKNRSWTKTATSNDLVNQFLNVKDLQYVVRSNKETAYRANERLTTKGYDDSLRHFESVVESGKFPSVDDIALGERLIQEAIKQGNFEKAEELIADVTLLGTELGQSVQAMSIIKRLSPAGQLMYLQKAVKRINEQERKKRKPTKKKTGLEKVIDEGKIGDTEIKIPDNLRNEILSAQTPEDLQRAVDRTKEYIASQLPVTLTDKLTEWRYLMMLGNPKTHVRNTVGNLVMQAPYEIKNFNQRVLETLFDSQLEERTATFKKASKAVKDFADAMIEENRDALTGTGYTNIQSELRSMRKIYKSKAINTLNQLNTNALELEDFAFKKRTFRNVLAEYLTANGIKTEADIKAKPELIQKAINYAIEEAKKATFNQYNAVATAISRFENSSSLGKVLIGGLAPFKRTPLNIVKTAWQYSPAGLAETLTKQTWNLRNGLITPNDYIERISQGLTGTGIALMGMLLASLGLIKGSLGSKKKDKYEQGLGLETPYSFQIGNKSIDISWLSPSAVPLLMGAEIYSALQDGEWLTMDDAIKVLEKTMNPVSKMTMLSTIDDALINYGGDDDVSGLAGIFDTVTKSYISQAFPTLGGQINRIIDPTIRSTAASKNSKFKTGEAILRQNANKVAGLSYMLEPSLDVWGNPRKRDDNIILRSVDALANPANITKDTSTEVDHEILRLYDANGNDEVIPTTPQKYFTANSEKYEMSASEYTEYRVVYGQTSYENLEKLFDSSEYKQMSDAEKETTIKHVYDDAKQRAKLDFLTNRYGEKEGMERLLGEKDMKKVTQARELLGIDYDEYLKGYYAQTGVEGEKDKNGKTISGTKKKNQIDAIKKALPKLTNNQAENLYKIYNGSL